MTTDYQPVACELHSAIELIIMRGQTMPIRWQDKNGQEVEKQARPVDVITRNKEEFLVIEDANQNRLEIRLDRLGSLNP